MKFRYFSLPWLDVKEERSFVQRRPRHTSLQSPRPVDYTWDRCTLETVYFGYLSTLNSFVACVHWMPQYTLLCSQFTLDASVHLILQSLYIGFLSTLYSVACVLWMSQYTLLCSLCTLDASVHFILQLVYFGCLSTLYSVACVLWMSQNTLFCSLCTLDVSVHFILQLVYFGCLSTLYSVACVLWMSQYSLLCSLCTVK